MGNYLVIFAMVETDEVVEGVRGETLEKVVEVFDLGVESLLETRMFIERGKVRVYKVRNREVDD